MGVLATATSLSGASLLQMRISCSCYVMSGKSTLQALQGGKRNLFPGYRSLCNAYKQRSKVAEKALGVHSALAVANVPGAVECQEKMSLPALTTQVLRCH